MRTTSRRIAALEDKHGDVGKFHVITCMPGTSMADALDLYGRERIGPNDQVIGVPAPVTARDV